MLLFASSGSCALPPGVNGLVEALGQGGKGQDAPLAGAE
jgi:hypothetical protein